VGAGLGAIAGRFEEVIDGPPDLLSPLAGWALPVEEIPDPVFAQRMVGDGVGIDPTGTSCARPATAACSRSPAPAMH
jgi:phosphotransferase system IIA component